MRTEPSLPNGHGLLGCRPRGPDLRRVRAGRPALARPCSQRFPTLSGWPICRRSASTRSSGRGPPRSPRAPAGPASLIVGRGPGGFPVPLIRDPLWRWSEITDWFAADERRQPNPDRALTIRAINGAAEARRPTRRGSRRETPAPRPAAPDRLMTRRPLHPSVGWARPDAPAWCEPGAVPLGSQRDPVVRLGTKTLTPQGKPAHGLTRWDSLVCLPVDS